MTQKELGYVELEWTCPACNTRNRGTARQVYPVRRRPAG